MNKKTHRVAVVGCGALAQGAHLPHCQRNPRVELVATCDIDAVNAEACRKKFGAQRAESDWRRVVEARDIDLCILCTHTNLRGEFIIPALESGKAVYTEKPLAPNFREMTDIVKATRRTGRPVCVGHNRRSSPAVLEFKRLADKALHGASSRPPTVNRMEQRKLLPEEKQLQILMRINDDSRSWKPWIFWDAEGILFAEMVHFIDLALWLNPGHPVRAFAEGSPRGNFSLLLRFNDGSITTIQHTMVGHFDYPKELFEATAGFITVGMDQHLEVRQWGMKDEPAQKFFPYAHGCDWAVKQGMAGYLQELEAEVRQSEKTGKQARWLNVNKGHYEQLDRFLTHLEGGGENPCPVDGAVAVNRVAMKLLESVRLGLPVAITPEDWHIPEL
ncbi:MAG: Gfo/Idh/MocA family oxidoreductase [Verrucomicrobiae bacterium]|nr:Gfo/Idh/MocA family oxidoreductase [Verrucomicrobiae bacterium]